MDRLSIFLPSLAGGGAERCMLSLAGGIAQRGYQVDLVLGRSEGPLLPEVPPDVRQVNLAAPRTLLAVPRLVGYLRRERPALLLSALDYANVLALWARRLAHVSTRAAVNEQNTISVTARHASQRRQRWVPALMKRCYPWADCIIGNSRGVAEDLARLTGLPLSRIQVIYNPVVTPRLHCLAKADPDHAWFSPGQPPVVLAGGRLVPQKDFPTLVNAFSRVRRNKTARLLILGEGPDRAALEDLIRRAGLAGCVQLAGFVANPYAFMSRAALFVLSSRWEGLPTVLVEAMACGTRVVATDCPSGPDEILRGGRYGTLVPVGDEAALAAAIEEGLDGSGSQPPSESWRPYELSSVVDEYIRSVLGD